MRVNVSKAFISKTFMCDLEVSLQRQLTKSNKKSLEFYLNLIYKLKKQTLVYTIKQLLLGALTILTEFAIFAILLLQTHLYEFIHIFMSMFNLFGHLTVLMNDFRLKTFYCKLSLSSITLLTKTSTSTSIATVTVTSTLNFKLTTTTRKLSTLPTTFCASSTSSSSAAVATTCNNKNNHYRTYNNSSKSNKVFLYYTPRDPRLRIFLKTKHFFNRPRQQQQQLQLNQINYIVYCIGANKRSIKVFSGFYNYGELIGGDHKSGEYNSDANNINCKQLERFNLLPTKNNICDNLIKTSDNLIFATAHAAIETISANILIVNHIKGGYIRKHIKELFKYLLNLSSFQWNQQQLKLKNFKSFNLHWICLNASCKFHYRHTNTD